MSAPQVGDRVIWRHELRAGYRHTEADTGRGGQVDRVRVLVEVPLKAGGTRPR